MVFYFASIFASGHLVEQDKFDSQSFDRNAVARYRTLIDNGEDFGEDLAEVHLEYMKTGPQSGTIEMSSGKGDVNVHLLANTDPDAAMKELNDVFADIRDSADSVGEIFQLKSRPLALALLPNASPEARSLSRYPIALAAAFFEAKSP